MHEREDGGARGVPAAVRPTTGRDGARLHRKPDPARADAPADASADAPADAPADPAQRSGPRIVRAGCGLVAEFDRPERLIAAVREVHGAGLRDLETYSPFPIADVARLLGYRTSTLSVVAVAAAIAGFAGTLWMQLWMNGIDYPLNVGGRPLASWPAFIPAAVIVGILAPAAAVLIGMLILCGLPRLHHPAFDLPGFERASEDRFFLAVRGSDPAFERGRVEAMLARHGPVAIRESDA